MPPSLIRVDANEPLDDILRVIERDGGVIVTNFLSPELLKESMDASESRPCAKRNWTHLCQLSLPSSDANCTIQKPHMESSEPTSFQKDLSVSM